MSYFGLIEADQFPANDTNGRARRLAIAECDVGDDFLQAMVDFRSRGRVLLLGSTARVQQALGLMGATAQCTVLVTDASGASLDGGQHTVYHAQLHEVQGHLGAFKCLVERNGQVLDLGEIEDAESPHFDIVIDLNELPLIRSEVSPLGYFAPTDDVALAQSLDQLDDYIGEFHKPRYFRYKPDICAHGRSGLDGCTRCIDNCPTDAIISVGETVEVNPYLCQGGGICTSSCPSGAMAYAWPPTAIAASRIQAAIAAFENNGGSGAVLLIHDGESGRSLVKSVAAGLDTRVIPFAVEEAASVGPEVWMAALAWGAASVALLVTDAVSASVRSALSLETDIANQIVAGAGLGDHRIRLINANASEPSTLLDVSWPAAHTLTHATFVIPEEKRSAIRVAVDHLYRTSESDTSVMALPQGSAFGHIVVDQDACTLCMACVSVCPASALQAGGDTPALRHIEWNCVQCGACETACPEDAVKLDPRFLYDNDQRMSTVTLNEEEPFLCVSCGKAFATASVMKRMEEKLADHWMFQKPEQRNRLKMCEDCRIQDMFDQGGGLENTDPGAS